ncbi:CAX-interacting protein 4 [Manihot esculenta]|uniref:CCHC-type domain-containing protein n=3 Tax=Manihot esculenta TaxID=3983 RepID=A0A251LHL8_MANES|nr:CAX-interacting protein 4 [Manihot esculenta]XP_043810103.1 CAX-interacting protein 4 [Manihot esculenta]KAG8660216.1 hypothetical protein MANES_02G133000v8 [Manihot esculenta]KAG8660217.1 hypothetical protein MANES_02G133000v8 [Manihot esculenta]OAY57885.1 hypothetical protein MANES_02G133000v8 [Manihot esculenta]OAY57886.1 hypothetical protein MANES_02G133000v8 [Manihot esculenta]
MPATAGRVRMPANNRVHSSAALQTHGIWQSAIGYDPYAPNKDDTKNSSQQKPSNAEPESENSYASFQGLLALARITGSSADEARGACKRCGRVGHLAYQCRNFFSVKDDKEKDPEAVQVAALSGLENMMGNGKFAAVSKESEEEDSDTSDSEADSEIERIIAERYGKRSSSKKRSSKKENSDEGSDSDSGERKKRGRSRKRSSKKRGTNDSENEDEGKMKKRRRRKRDESSEDEEERQHYKRKNRKEKRRRRRRRRISHSYTDDSQSDASDDSARRQRRKSRKSASASDSDVSGSDDSRVGRVTKRHDKRVKSATMRRMGHPLLVKGSMG